MVWPFTDSATYGNDPLKDLDPSLKHFLEKESPVKYSPPAPPPPEASPQSSETSLDSAENTITSLNDDSATTHLSVPKESLFQDGRYAHLWKTYTPQHEIESAYRTDQEKMTDILSAYKDRKRSIGKAALENCSFEQSALYDCWREGSIKDTMTMCRKENRKFNRCYEMQSKFLKALGYMSSWERPREVDEGIQLHADELYYRMLDQEKAVEEAKAAGLPEPTFEPLIQRKPVTNPFAAAASGMFARNEAGMNPPPVPPSTDGQQQQQQPPGLPISGTQDSVLSPMARIALAERLKNSTQQERELEERAAETEVYDAAGVFMDVRKLQEKAKKERAERKEKGEAGIGDYIASFLGW